MNRLSTDASRHSLGFAGGRPPPSPGAKRNSGLAPSEINSMFPDAAAAIAKQKADFTQKTGTEPRSNRSSAVVGDRASLIAPSINGPTEDSRKDSIAQHSPWGRSSARKDDAPERPKSSQGQQPMGQFQQPPPSAGLRSGRPTNLTSDGNIQSTSVNVPNHDATGINMLSPYTGNWGSLTNTPMVPTFNNPNQQQQSGPQADLVANATAMKLAALSTVNNRVQLDDARKFRRARSSEGHGPTSPGIPPNQFLTDGHGQMLSPQQAAALQAQQLAAMQSQRSRPVSPNIAISGPNAPAMPLTQNGGFLSAYGAAGFPNGMAAMGLNPMTGSMGPGSMSSISSMTDGFLHDPNEIQRGRSPRGKRGNSRPPEDPTDPDLLKDIPAWLRSLRLHKYTDVLKDMKWQDLVRLDEQGLENKGVTAKGARTKMLKVSKFGNS